MDPQLRIFLYLLPILIVSMALHELAHGFVADRLGDPTSRAQGRLTLNPIKHLDPLGSLMFAITYFSSGGSFMFGWARPIEVQPQYFRSARNGMAMVAVAGPLTNFVLAVGFAWMWLHSVAQPGTMADVVIFRAFQINVVLGVLNLLPIPPLDGSRIIGVIMPERLYMSWRELDRFGMIFLFLAFFVFNGPFSRILSTGSADVETWILTALGG